MSITAQAKRDGYGACGILVPNTYFGEAAHRKSAGDLDVWRKQGAFIRKAGEARPAAKRLPRVLWRGKCLNNEYHWGSTALAYAFEIGQVQTMKNCPVACRLCRDSKNCRDSTTWRRGHPPRQPESCEWVSKKVKHRCGGARRPSGICSHSSVWLSVSVRGALAAVPRPEPDRLRGDRGGTASGIRRDDASGPTQGDRGGAAAGMRIVRGGLAADEDRVGMLTGTPPAGLVRPADRVR